MITHFSHPDDWIIDACSGSGVGFLAALEKGRHVVAVEIEQRQVDTWPVQLLKLETNLQILFKEKILSKEDNNPNLKDHLSSLETPNVPLFPAPKTPIDPVAPAPENPIDPVAPVPEKIVDASLP